MDRRTYLAALATAATAGCLGDRSAASAGTGSPPDGVSTATAPTESSTLAFGEWHRTVSVDVTVTDASTTSRLPADGSTPVDVLPEETKLVVVSLLLENATDSPLTFPEDVRVSVGVVASGRLFESAGNAVSRDGQLSAAVESYVDEPGPSLASGKIRLPPGEQVRVWQAVLVPEDLSTADVQVTVCVGDDCGVHWAPSGKTCDCPG